ncbi:6-phospho-3-hexuloisomerase [Levilactobacillus namurensis]|uniref:6-phospho-3-hexuloisomerase n=1 Tax=Levilactobacillus namurensis TaxID=380393 RepID=UPI001DF9E741|nr:6-phospho-3-hexuloisomerase [Levilactobacillus namurensis]MCW3778389.1 6-phospho-3-hexuloisomerase [Levilactobacillus namurensis]MDT7019723.1 6-phospho-3-hexuloisomerase [Levilactobacillus namurensis]WNN65689.1 6-phospho-3-hexuloisomerase [Levilactobacillus namurensis]HJE45020.1 6-phospho-3-hexuloisomerase [Levilactobacillus namurensis]
MTLIEQVTHEVNEVMGMIDERQLDAAEKLITKKTRIFVLGAGRSGLMAKGFAMRLMHIGYTVYVIGETITPSIQAGDVLLSVSGSGKTASILELTEKAHANGVKVVAVTSHADSPLGKVGDTVIVVPGATKAGDGVHSIQLLSTLFDQSVHITLDILCLKLSRRDNISNASAAAEHSNME